MLIEIDAKDGKEGLKIKEFSFDDMVKNPAIVMIAKRGSGKSYICRAMLHYFKDIPCGIIISKTERMSSFYGEFFPESFIFFEYKTTVIEKIMKRQLMIIEKSNRKKAEGTIIDPRSFILMDDCLASRGEWVRDQPIQELLFNGRHYHITYILTMQFPLGITPDLRSNFDYIFLMADDIQSNLKKIYDHYAGMFPNFYSFRQIFTELTKDFGCMVINNRGSRINIFDKIFYYRAPEYDNNQLPKIGCRQFNKFHEKNFNSKWRTSSGAGLNFDEMMNENKKRKNNIKIRIMKKDEN